MKRKTSYLTTGLGMILTGCSATNQNREVQTSPSYTGEIIEIQRITKDGIGYMFNIASTVDGDPGVESHGGWRLRNSKENFSLSVGGRVAFYVHDGEVELLED